MVVVLAGLIVLSLALVGIIPLFPSSSSKGSVLTYDQALPLANGAAQGASGGSWALIEGDGINSLTSVSENLSSAHTTGCNLTIQNGESETVTLPVGTPNATGGSATSWLFLYRNAAEEVLMVTVLDGSASVLATIAAGQSCSTVFALLNVVPSDVIDSASAAADIQGIAATFLAGHTGITSKYAVVGGINFLGVHEGARWSLNYSTCPEEAPTGTTGASFNATVNATSGAVIFSEVHSAIACPSSSTISLVRDAGTGGVWPGQLIPSVFARER